MTQVDYSSNVRFGGGEIQRSEWADVTHVRFRGASDDQVRWGSNADPRGALEPDAVYELERAEIYSWHTKLFLRGVDSGRGFNSVSFEAVEQ